MVEVTVMRSRCPCLVIVFCFGLVMLVHAQSGTSTTPITLSFTGTGNGNSKGFSLSGSGSIQPFGAATASIGGQKGAVSFTFALSDGDMFSATAASAITGGTA